MTLTRLSASPSMTSTYDHRVIQGAESGLLLKRVDELLNGDSGQPDWEAITYDNFESGFGSFTSGGNDCILSTQSRHAAEGVQSVNLQDNAGIDSALYHTTGQDVTSYTELRVEFSFKMMSMETGEDFWLEFYDGSTWQTVTTFVQGDYNNRSIYDISIVLDRLQVNFPVDAKLRFTCDAGDNRDDVYIDQVSFMGK